MQLSSENERQCPFNLSHKHRVSKNVNNAYIFYSSICVNNKAVQSTHNSWFPVVIPQGLSRSEFSQVETTIDTQMS